MIYTTSEIKSFLLAKRYSRWSKIFPLATFLLSISGLFLSAWVEPSSILIALATLGLGQLISRDPLKDSIPLVQKNIDSNPENIKKYQELLSSR